MKASSQKVDPLALSRREPSPPVSPSRRLQWRPGLPRLSAALPAALGLLCLLLAFKASFRFSGDLFFRASPASVAAARPAEAPPMSGGDSVSPPGASGPCGAEVSVPPPSDGSRPGGDSSSPGAHGKEPREPGGSATGCGEGPAQLPSVASLDLRGGSPLPAHHLAGAPPPRSEAERSPPRPWRAVASAADLPRPLSAGIAPFLPRAPPHA